MNDKVTDYNKNDYGGFKKCNCNISYAGDDCDKCKSTDEILKMSYNDFMLFRGEAGCRETGRLRKEGKDYNVQDGDIINFLFNV